MGKWRRLWRGLALAVTGLHLLSCEQPVAFETGPIGRIEVDPSSAVVAAGRTATLAARVYDVDGGDMGARPLFWSTQDASIATVNQSGVVTGVTAGAVQIAASLNGRSGVASITVTPPSVVVVRVNPNEGDVAIGRTLQLTADPLDGDGQPLTGRVASWTTVNAAIATVSSAGMVSGVSAGTTTVRATIDGIDGSALIRVIPVAVAQVSVNPGNASIPQGDFVQLAATTRDASGGTLTGRFVEWSSNNQTVAVVSNTGRVQSVSPGSAIITAKCEGVIATATITVTQVPVASVTIVPANPTVVTGQTATLSATVRDGQGNVLNGRAVSWSSTAPAIASVSTAGVLSGVAVGSATIRATSNGITGSTIATVSAVPVASVQVTPPSAAISVGATQQLAAVARDGQGNVLTGRTATWTTNNASVATVNNTGLVTAAAVGAATITASMGGVTGTSTITVSVVPVASVVVTPNPASLEEKTSLQLTATARDAGNNILSGRTIVFSSSNNAVAGVSQTGLVTGIAPGSATITASAPNQGAGGSSPSGTAPLSVTYAPVAVVQVLPGTASVQVGGTTTFAATLFDGNGQPLSPAGRAVLWVSLDPSRATVNGTTGVATGVSTGTATIRASASSPGQGTTVTGSASLTIITVPVASVTVSPSTATVHVGTAYAVGFTAVTQDGSGNVLTGRNIVWTSSNQGIATVDASSGIVTGVGPGSTSITATSEGVAGTAGVTVDLVPVLSVTVSPPSATLAVPATQQLAATAFDSAGNPLSGSALGARVAAWSSSNAGVATVSTSGLVTSVTVGSTTITGTIDGIGGTSSIAVLGPVHSVAMTLGDTLFLPGSLAGSVVVTDAGGNLLPGKTVTLTSSSQSAATVSPSSAVSDAAGSVSFTVTGGAQGNTTITASSNGKSAAKLVRVLRPVAFITFSPTSLTVGVLPMNVVATARDANQVSLSGRFCTIVSNDTTIATATPASATTSGTGRITITVTGRATGQTTVTVTCEKVSNSFNVTVP